MFDWPVQIHTSPTSTFFSVIVLVPAMVSSKGPPALSWFKSTRHLPSLSASADTA